VGQEISSKESPGVLPAQSSDEILRNEPQREQAPKGKGQEGKHRGLSKEMKRASVLMTLDAAGVSIDEVVRDAKARQGAIDIYQAEQRRLFEAQWARKAEENLQIQAELETVKARYMERVRRNLDGVAREKATFGNWLAMKQREAQRMAEAVELCAKAPGADASSGSVAEVSLIDASAKPV
jgi:hypothetical protein